MSGSISDQIYFDRKEDKTLSELKLGKMKGLEIAEWLGVSYNTYHHSIDKQLSKLNGYCEYKKVWGGAEITKIYIPIYKGELKSSIIDDVVEEIKIHPISTSSGIARKFKNQCRKAYDNYDDDSLRRAVARATRITFGRVQKEGSFQVEEAGAYGYRFGEWAVRESLYNDHRAMTVEELQLFKDIISEIYHKNPDKVLKEEGLIEDLCNGDLTIEEFKEEREKGGTVFYTCLQEFKVRTGLTLVRASNHHISNYEEMQALEEEQKGAFVAEDKSAE